MQRSIEEWLMGLCDPGGLRPGLSACPLRGKELTQLRILADRHGVLPAVVRNLRDNSLQASQEMEKSGAAGRLAQLAAVGIFLQVRARELFSELQRKGIPALLIKGPVVAQRAYRPASLRTYIDIDFLVSRNAWEKARGVMRAVGFEPKAMMMKHAAGYGEEPWMHRDHPGCSFEMHWNLVNSPTIRRGISVRYEDLDPPAADDPLGNGTPAADLLLIAAVHGAASHSFDKLQHLCDVAQIARGTAGAVDARRLAELARATGAELAVHTALWLTAQTLGDQACIGLLSRLGLDQHASTSSILSPRTVIRGQQRDLASRLRRGMFRQALKRRHTQCIAGLERKNVQA